MSESDEDVRAIKETSEAQHASRGEANIDIMRENKSPGNRSKFIPFVRTKTYARQYIYIYSGNSLWRH